jgi:N-acetylneuraminic acid mutarotase
MKVARWKHASVMLKDGKILIIGGIDLSLEQGVDLFDPAANTITAAAKMSEGRARHTATLLQDGRVLVTGGGKDVGPTFSATAEVYDPASNTWTAVGSMSDSRTQHTGTLLQDGRVLIVGGLTMTSGGSVNRLASAELYDPVTNTWSTTGSMSVGRSGHATVLLPDGRVLTAGGIGLNSTEIWDPATGAWSAGPAMVEDRSYFAIVALKSGAVFALGGQRGDTLSNTGETFQP